MELKSNYRFIRDFELPVVDRNEEWLTNMWVYYVASGLGAIIGLYSMWLAMSELTMGASVVVALKLCLFVVLAMGGGCLITSFFAIPDWKIAFKRSVFNLVAVAVVFIGSAVLSVVVIILLVMMFVGLMLATGGGGRSSSASKQEDDGTITDGNGNTHYVSSSLGNGRVQTTDGDTMRRESDGTYRRI